MAQTRSAPGPAPAPVDVQTCKAWGHQMDPLGGPPAGFDDPWVDGWVQWLRCDRCGTLRVVVLGLTSGKVTSSRYHYPEGYLHADRSYVAPTKQELRIEQAREYARARDRGARRRAG